MNRTILFLTFLFLSLCVYSQSRLILKKESTSTSPSSFPNKIDLFVAFEENSSELSLSNIDLLDSVYRIAFSETNPYLYKLMFMGYDDEKEIDETNNSLVRDRVDVIYTYFKNRCKSDYLIRVAPNLIYNSCTGYTNEMVRYQVPIEIEWIHLLNLPEAKRKQANIPLSGKVWIHFEHNREACLGYDSNCYLPNEEVLIKGQAASVVITKGAFSEIRQTKNACQTEFQLTMEEHLDPKKILEKYFLVPHNKQIILQSGFVVLQSPQKTLYGQCTEPLSNSISVRIDGSAEQLESKVRLFAKFYTEQGVEYKSLNTKRKKEKTGGYTLEATLNSMQVDTIFIGFRIKPEEIKNYLYPAKDSDYSTVKIQGEYYKPYKIDKKGEYQLKKPMQALFNFPPTGDEQIEPVKEKKKTKKEKDTEEKDEELE